MGLLGSLAGRGAAIAGWLIENSLGLPVGYFAGKPVVATCQGKLGWGRHAGMGKGWWSQKAPRVKEIVKICNGVQLRDARWRRGVLEGTQDDV